jgi:hypothetical protein
VARPVALASHGRGRPSGGLYERRRGARLPALSLPSMTKKRSSATCVTRGASVRTHSHR